MILHTTLGCEELVGHTIITSCSVDKVGLPFAEIYLNTRRPSFHKYGEGYRLWFQKDATIV